MPYPRTRHTANVHDILIAQADIRTVHQEAVLHESEVGNSLRGNQHVGHAQACERLAHPSVDVASNLNMIHTYELAINCI